MLVLLLLVMLPASGEAAAGLAAVLRRREAVSIRRQAFLSLLLLQPSPACGGLRLATKKKVDINGPLWGQRKQPLLLQIDRVRRVLLHPAPLQTRRNFLSVHGLAADFS